MGSVMPEVQIFWAVDVDGCIMVLFLIDNMGSGDFFSMLLLYDYFDVGT